MRPGIKILATTVMMLALGLNFTGCSSMKKKSTTGDGMSEMGSTGDDSALELNADSDSGKASQLSTVYFDFDSSALSSSTKDALNANAEFLKANPKVEVQIEGHCDERGGTQYNLALGERRAKAAKNYLVAMGIARKRVKTISYGKEKPLAFGHDESSWSKNRRANFVVTAK